MRALYTAIAFLAVTSLSAVGYVYRPQSSNPSPTTAPIAATTLGIPTKSTATVLGGQGPVVPPQGGISCNQITERRFRFSGSVPTLGTAWVVKIDRLTPTGIRSACSTPLDENGYFDVILDAPDLSRSVILTPTDGTTSLPSTTFTLSNVAPAFASVTVTRTSTSTVLVSGVVTDDTTVSRGGLSVTVLSGPAGLAGMATTVSPGPFATVYDTSKKVWVIVPESAGVWSITANVPAGIAGPAVLSVTDWYGLTTTVTVNIP